MRTCSVPTPRDRPGPDGFCLPPTASPGRRPPGGRAPAFTLVELLVVMALVSLLVVVAQVNLLGALRRSTFQAQVQDFISTMQMAISNASETGQRYEVIIDLGEQSYLLRKLTGADLTGEPLVEQIITQGQFSGNCRVTYVEFDDGEEAYKNQDRAKFRAGRAGWQYGGKIVFLEGERPHAVIVNRVTPIIQLLEGDPPLMKPKMKIEVPFL